jgi:hypothetical protein
VDFKPQLVRRNKEGHFILIKRAIHQEGITSHDKERAHKGGMRIGKTPKKLDSICCPQCREIYSDTL